MEELNPKLVELWEKVKKARKYFWYTQVELAKETWIDRTYISMIEKWATNPSYLKVKKLEEVLGDKF